MNGSLVVSLNACSNLRLTKARRLSGSSRRSFLVTAQNALL